MYHQFVYPRSYSVETENDVSIETRLIIGKTRNPRSSLFSRSWIEGNNDFPNFLSYGYFMSRDSNQEYHSLRNTFTMYKGTHKHI